MPKTQTVAIALTAMCSLPAQTFTWRLESPVNEPPTRTRSCMAHDAARGRTVLFGGYDGSFPMGDVWEWDGSTWTAAFSQHYPPARVDARMAYDSARNRIVLFGGDGNGLLGDTWEYDGVDWVEVTPAFSPAPRRLHAMTYDSARQRVVLFGGAVQGGLNGQTWEWDGAAWIVHTPNNSPSPRVEHAIAYDPVRQRTVLYGGKAGLNQERDTWEWDGVDWILRSATTSAMPNGRHEHAMAYDEVRQTVVLFGGNGGNANNLTVEWNGSGWQIQTPAMSPPATTLPAMAFDTTRQRMVLLAGNQNGNTTWTRGQFGTTAVATQYGAGCGTPPLTLNPSANARPIIGQLATATIDDSPTGIAAVAIGWRDDQYGPFTLPVTLAGIGMPGCELLQSSDVLGLIAVPTSPSSLIFGQALPNDLAIVGATVFLQAYAFAPGENEREVVVSNGVEWFVGDL